MKIKTKKQLNLPQLIEWAWENPELSRNKHFVSENKEFPYVNQYVIFNEVSYAEIESSYCYGRNDLFTVTTEEELTEDTVIPKMLEKSFDAYQNVVLDIQVNQSINTVKENAEVLTLHVINDDDTHTLIWRNGKLVD